MPKVSVIIPVYNCAGYIAKAIESVMNQTFKDIEVIVVDDGSRDNTQGSVDACIKRFPGKIKLFQQANQGSSVARNHGIQKSSGEYVAFLDADDWWEADKLQKQLDYFHAHPEVALTFTNANVIKNGQVTRTYVRPEDKNAMNDDLFYNIFFRNFIPFSSVVVKRSVIDKTGHFDPELRSTQDFDFLLRIIRSHKIDYVEECLTNYLVHDSNVSKRLDFRHRDGISILEKNLAQYPDMYEKMGSRLKTHLPHRYFELGYALFALGDVRQARMKLWKSIQLNPFYHIKVYLYFCASLFPENLINGLRSRKLRLSKKS